MPQARNIAAVTDAIKLLGFVMAMRFDIGIIGASGNLHFIIQKESSLWVLAPPGLRVCAALFPPDISVIQRPVLYAEQGIAHSHI